MSGYAEGENFQLLREDTQKAREAKDLVQGGTARR